MLNLQIKQTVYDVVVCRMRRHAHDSYVQERHIFEGSMIEEKRLPKKKKGRVSTEPAQFCNS